MDALEKATSYLNRKSHTEKEVKDYLLRKGYEEDESAEAVRRLKEYGFLNDLAYAKLYFEYGFEKGPLGTEIRLYRASERQVEQRDSDYTCNRKEQIVIEESMIARLFVPEVGKEPNEMTYEEKQKLQARIARRLASRGFSGSICWSTARDAVK